MAATMWKNSMKNENLITIKFYMKSYSNFFTVKQYLLSE